MLLPVIILQLLILNRMLLLPKWMLKINQVLLLQLLRAPLSWSMFRILLSRNNHNLYCHLNLLPCLHPLCHLLQLVRLLELPLLSSHVVESSLPFSIESPTPPSSSSSSAPSTRINRARSDGLVDPLRRVANVPVLLRPSKSESPRRPSPVEWICERQAQ